MQIPLFTPINYPNPISFEQRSLNFLSNCFCLNGKKAVVISGNKVELRYEKHKWYTTAIKIAAMTILFPITLLSLGIYALLKSRHSFTVQDKDEISRSEKVENTSTSRVKFGGQKSYLKEAINVDINSYAQNPTQWVDVSHSILYFKYLALNHPEFSPFYDVKVQLSTSESKAKLLTILNYLPAEITQDQSPYLYAHPLQVSGNHRTAFLIDLRNFTVEYYNSFGVNQIANVYMLSLTEALSLKYKKKFTYEFKTETKVQHDGHHCGVWACKFIEERLNPNSEVKNLINFDIKNYRKEFYEKIADYNYNITEGGEILIQAPIKIAAEVFDILIKNHPVDHTDKVKNNIKYRLTCSIRTMINNQIHNATKINDLHRKTEHLNYSISKEGKLPEEISHLLNVDHYVNHFKKDFSKIVEGVKKATKP